MFKNFVTPDKENQWGEIRNLLERRKRLMESERCRLMEVAVRQTISVKQATDLICALEKYALEKGLS